MSDESQEQAFEVQLPEGVEMGTLFKPVPEDAPEEWKSRLAEARAAFLASTCPECGAELKIHTWGYPADAADDVQQNVRCGFHMAHLPECPLGDDALRALAASCGIEIPE